MNYPINEIFRTIQGEGRFAGTPSTFVRLQGCDVGCPWCDTKPSWPNNQDDLQSINQIANQCTLQRHVVITGGEPCMHDLDALIAELLSRDHYVQIETSGTYPLPSIRSPSLWFTVSPKFGMPGGLPVRDDALEDAHEIKYVFTTGTAFLRRVELLQELKEKGKTISLQPVSQQDKATENCIKYCLEYGFNLSIQTHKYLEIP